jgi:hypothetical protein
VRATLRRVAIGVLVVLGLGAMGLVCQRVGERGRYVSSFSTYGAGPDGTRGLYLLAEELGARPARWAEDLGRLPERGMLVALGSCDQLMRRQLGRLERESLEAWVRRGGVLVVAGVPDYLQKETMGVALRADPERCRPTEGLIGMLARAEAERRDESAEDDAARELEELPDALAEDPVGTYDEVTAQEELAEARLAAPVGPGLAGIPPIGMRRALEVELAGDVRGDTLLRLDGPGGRPVGVVVELGSGAVIALGSASAFTNRDLREGGGVLFARLVREHAPEGPILFDEYHLGVGQQRSMMRYLRQIGATATVLQLLLLVGFVLWRAGARFGGTRGELPPDPGGTASYVDGVARLYQKSGDPDGAARIVIRRALTRIAAHHHLGTSDPDRMVELLAGRSRHAAAEAVVLLAKHLEDQRGTRGLTRLAAEVDALVLKAIPPLDNRETAL